MVFNLQHVVTHALVADAPFPKHITSNRCASASLFIAAKRALAAAKVGGVSLGFAW